MNVANGRVSAGKRGSERRLNGIDVAVAQLESAASHCPRRWLRPLYLPITDP